jgi:hypothetical protein
MKNATFRLMAVAGIAFASIVGTPGCGTIEEGDGVDVVTEESAVRGGFGFPRHHRRPRDAGTTTGGASGGSPGTGATGGTTGTVNPGTDPGSTPVADCDVCAKANACCLAVNGGTLCTFSATTCSTVAPASRAPYINGCLTLLTQAVAAHQAARATPPAACQ